MNRSIFLPGFILALTGTAFGMHWLINVDAAAILELSRQVLDGKTLYQDIFETQFPAIYLISMLVVWLSGMVDISVVHMFFFCVFITLNVSIMMAWRILRTHPLFETPARQCILLSILYFSLFILPFLERNWHLSFGEREHLFCALILPYVALALNRIQIHSSLLSSKQGVPLISGILAGIGFAIKPHFLLILLASECFMVWYTKNIWFWLRKENLMIFVMLFLYYLGMLLFTPHYFQLLPYIRDFYQGVAISPWDMAILCFEYFCLPLLVFIWFVFEKKLRPVRRPVPFLLCLTVASIVVFALGRGAFYYHSFPIRWFSLLVGAFMFSTLSRKMLHLFMFPFFMFVLVLFIFGWHQFLNAHDKRNFVLKLVQKMQRYAAQGTVVAFDTNLAPTFPAITYANVRWGLSMPWLLYIPAVYKDYSEQATPPFYHAPNKMGKTEFFFHEKVMHDLLEHPPELIMVNISSQLAWLGNMRFDFIQYFSNDIRFARFWKNYHLVSHVENFDFYQRTVTSSFKNEMVPCIPQPLSKN